MIYSIFCFLLFFPLFFFAAKYLFICLRRGHDWLLELSLTLGFGLMSLMSGAIIYVEAVQWMAK